MNKLKCVVGCIASVALTFGLQAQDEVPKPPKEELVPLPIEKLERTEPVDFAKEIYPMLKKNCIACHSQSEDKAGLVLETPDRPCPRSDCGRQCSSKKLINKSE